MVFTQIDTQYCPCSTSTECGAPCRWGDILKSIFLYVKLFPACLFHSAVLWDWQVTHCLGSGGGFEKKFARWVLSSPSVHLRLVRWPGMWESGGDGGTRLRRAVEMAVSIKYHFQFPCFMIPGLLSTNNPPSAGPPTLSWRRLITLVASHKKDIYMKIRKQLLCLHGSESRTKAIPNLIFIQRRGKITISWRLIWVSFGGRATGGGWRRM